MERLKTSVFRRFPQNSQWRRRLDVLLQSVRQSGIKRRPEKFSYKWLHKLQHVFVTSVG